MRNIFLDPTYYEFEYLSQDNAKSFVSERPHLQTPWARIKTIERGQNNSCRCQALRVRHWIGIPLFKRAKAKALDALGLWGTPSLPTNQFNDQASLGTNGGLNSQKLRLRGNFYTMPPTHGPPFRGAASASLSNLLPACACARVRACAPAYARAHVHACARVCLGGRVAGCVKIGPANKNTSKRQF